MDDNSNMRVNTNERKVVKDLGTMNGWVDQPTEYTKHLAECGTERETVWSDTVNGVITHIPKMVRVYNETQKQLGNCYNEYACNDCGCTWSVDSSG